mmetsp:Transcript_45597/g.125988  ORF Transcript_45597/g.125988 Transcript_45597/m.125988 type:complete len:213 (-) Transcript_45597:1373-2011(-)
MICTVHKRGTRKNAPKRSHPLSTLGVEVQRDKKRVLAAVGQDGHALKVRVRAGGLARSCGCFAVSQCAVLAVVVLRPAYRVPTGTVSPTFQIFVTLRSHYRGHATTTNRARARPCRKPAPSAALAVALTSSLVCGCVGLARPCSGGVGCGDTRPTRATRVESFVEFCSSSSYRLLTIPYAPFPSPHSLPPLPHPSLVPDSSRPKSCSATATW